MSLEVLAYVLSLLSAAVCAGQWLGLRAALAHFQGGAPGPCRLPMTVIRPVRGLDDGFEDGLRALADADPAGVLQIIVAMEDPEDPAYAAVEAFRAAHPGRDIHALVAGPAGARMGHMHNKIAALARAKHRFILFSDADALVSPALLADAERAFREGADAVSAAAFHAAPRREGDWWFLIAHNHCFSASAAARYRAGGGCFNSGVFMGFTRETIERLGGLEAFADSVADDVALGTAALRLGARQQLLRVPVFVRESGSSVGAAFSRWARWGAISFWMNPAVWLMSALLNPVLLAGAAAGAAAAGGGGLAAAGAALAFALLTRAGVAALQDRALAYRLPPLGYARLLLADAALLAAWPLALRRTYAWRGRRYRLSLGGACVKS